MKQNEKIMTTQTATIAAQELAALFSNNENVYSLGFTRILKLNRRQSLNAFTKLFLEGFTEIPANNAELKNRLAAMTEAEYKNFKQGNN